MTMGNPQEMEVSMGKSSDIFHCLGLLGIGWQNGGQMWCIYIYIQQIFYPETAILWQKDGSSRETEKDGSSRETE